MMPFLSLADIMYAAAAEFVDAIRWFEKRYWSSMRACDNV